MYMYWGLNVCACFDQESLLIQCLFRRVDVGAAVANSRTLCMRTRIQYISHKLYTNWLSRGKKNIRLDSRLDIRVYFYVRRKYTHKAAKFFNLHMEHSGA